MSENKSYDIVDWLKDSAPPGPLGRRMAEAAAEIARLRAERDEARTLLQQAEAMLTRTECERDRAREANTR